MDTPVPDTAAGSEPAPARTGLEEGMSQQAGDDAAAEGGMLQAADGGKKQRTGERGRSCVWGAPMEDAVASS